MAGAHVTPEGPGEPDLRGKRDPGGPLGLPYHWTNGTEAGGAVGT